MNDADDGGLFADLGGGRVLQVASVDSPDDHLCAERTRNINHHSAIVYLARMPN